MSTDSDDIRADLAAAVSTVEQATPGSTGGLADVVKPVEILVDKVEAKPEGEAEGRVRGPDGKFLAKDKSGVEVEQKAEKTAPDATKADVKPQEGEKPDATEVKTRGAPAAWKPDIKAKWEQIDPAVRSEIERRELEFARFTTEKGGELNRIKSSWEEVERGLGADADMLRVNYGSLENGLKTLMNLSKFAGKQPRQFLDWFAQQHGMDLKTLAAQESGEPSAQKSALDPEIRREIDGLKSTVQSFQQSAQQQQLTQRAADIASVANETDDQGNPLRPFFDELRAEIGPLLQMISRQNPTWSVRDVTIAAYDKASRLNDDVFNRMQQARASKETEDKAVKARAEAASLSRKTVIGGPPNQFTPPAGSDLSLRDEIAQQVHASMGSPARL